MKVALVKILWMSLPVEGATWEAEAAMKTKYPHLFHFDSTPALGISSSSVLSYSSYSCLNLVLVF